METVSVGATPGGVFLLPRHPNDPPVSGPAVQVRCSRPGGTVNEQEAFRPDGNDPDDDQSEFDLTGEFKIDFAAPAWYASNDTSGGGAGAAAAPAAPPASSPTTPP